ncbi:MmgE/PrpD family protein [Chloroflexota bacterium]
MGATRRLAEFIHDLSYDDIPENTIAKAKLLFLNWAGVTVGGYVDGQSEMNPMVEALSPFFGQPQATLITKKKKIDLINATLINGTASHYLDFDDDDFGKGIGHPGPPVIPAAVAMGEYREVNGKKLIEAIVAGVEAGGRIGDSVRPEHYNIGWHGTATLGIFGACAAAAKIIGLSADKIVTSLGITGTQAAGLRQSFGTTCKPLHAGKAASNGTLAVVLAENGFTAPQQILEGDWGFGRVLSPKFDETKINNFGQPFKIEDVVYKRYPSCYDTHAHIWCILGIRDKYQLKVSDVVSVTMKASSFAYMNCNNPQPKTGLEGKFSIRYCAALALLKGKARVLDFTVEAVKAPEIREAMAKINVIPDKSLKKYEAEVCIKTTDGKEIKERLNLMNLELKVSIAEWESMLEAKCGDLMQGAFPSNKVSNIISAIEKLEEIDNIKNVVELMS